MLQALGLSIEGRAGLVPIYLFFRMCGNVALERGDEDWYWIGAHEWS